MDNRRLLSPTGTPLEPLEKRVYQRLKSLRPFFENQVVIVAVSGGVDSVVLLRVLLALEPRMKWKLHVVHVNHSIRGRASDADARFVKKQAQSLKVPCTLAKLKNISRSASENLLRRKRYEILFKVKAKLKGAFIVTAHHKDDLLETRLMRLLQGTGIHGLQAMTLCSEDKVLRPLLDVDRAEIEKYATKRGMDWRNDATNKDTTKLRNWIRYNWLARLNRDHPEYVPNLFNSLERLIQNNIFLPQNTEKTFNRDLLTTEHPNILDQKIYNYLRYHARKRITSQHISEFRKRLSTSRKRFNFRLAGVDWQVESKSVFPAKI